MPIKNDPKICFYDFETTYLLARIWRPGKQVVRHDQLDDRQSAYKIISVAYCFNDDKPAKVIGWGYHKQDSAGVIAKFNRVLKREKPDIVIGKNSDHFDVKHANAQQWLNRLEPFPEWALITDDVEKQIRRAFALPSYSLDYVSKQLGLGGKKKMEFQHWIDIVEKINPESYKTMLEYNIKDTEDTRALYYSIKPYILQPKFNMATFKGIDCCINCGSEDIKTNGSFGKGKTRYIKYKCNTNGCYAGSKRISDVSKTPTGKMG